MKLIGKKVFCESGVREIHILDGVEEVFETLSLALSGSLSHDHVKNQII